LPVAEMSLLLVLPIALGLAMDAFAVSVGVSVGRGGLSGLQAFRLAASFGIFQFIMPILGWLTGQTVLDIIKSVDHWVAFGLLLLIGAKMIYESFKGKEESTKSDGDPTKGIILVVLSVATSIDALAVGLSFAALEQSILLPSILIGVVAFLMTVAGTKIGPVIGGRMGKRAELIGGIILILIGVKILADHLG
jgi:putative Mn2+ efflux pump MntP